MNGEGETPYQVSLQTGHREVVNSHAGLWDVVLRTDATHPEVMEEKRAKIRSQKMMAWLGVYPGVWVSTHKQSNMTPMESASSAAPGLGKVLSRCALASAACFFPSGVPSDMHIMMLVRSA